MSTAANSEMEPQNITSNKSHSMSADPQKNQEQVNGENSSENMSHNCQSMDETAADTAAPVAVVSENQGHCSDDNNKTSATTTSPNQSQLEASAQELNNHDASSNNTTDNNRESSMRNNKTDRRKSSANPGVGIKYVETESLSSLLLYDSDSSSSFSSEEQAITTKQHNWKNDRQKSPSADSSSSSSSSSESESDTDEDDNDEDTTEDDDDEENEDIIEDLSGSDTDDEDQLPEPPKDSRNNKGASQNNKGAIRKNQGSSELEKEWGLADLPQVPDLSSLTINDGENVIHMGTVMGIIDQLVTVNSLPDMPAYDSETVLFLDEGRKPLGIVFDLLGQVSSPIYAVRFNSTEEIKQLGVEVGAKVYAAPTSNHTRYVFIRELLKQKGSDASWMDDDEIPVDFADFSDDDEEFNARAKRIGGGGGGGGRRHRNHCRTSAAGEALHQAASASLLGGEAVGTNIFGRALIPTLAERIRGAPQPSAVGAGAATINTGGGGEYRHILMRMAADSGLLFRDGGDRFLSNRAGQGSGPYTSYGHHSFNVAGGGNGGSRRHYSSGGGGGGVTNYTPDNHKRFESTMNRRNLLNTKLNRYMDSYKHAKRQKYPASPASETTNDAGVSSGTLITTTSSDIIDNFLAGGGGNIGSGSQSSAAMFVQFDPTVPPPNLRPAAAPATSSATAAGSGNTATTFAPKPVTDLYTTAWHPPPPTPSNQFCLPLMTPTSRPSAPAPSAGVATTTTTTDNNNWTATSAATLFARNNDQSTSSIAYYHHADWLPSERIPNNDDRSIIIGGSYGNLGGAIGMELLRHLPAPPPPPSSHSRGHNVAMDTSSVLTNNTASAVTHPNSVADAAVAAPSGIPRPRQQ